VESITITKNWFIRSAKENLSKFRVLIFHVTGDRNTETLMKCLAEPGLFSLVIFCPPIASAKVQNPGMTYLCDCHLLNFWDPAC